MISTQFAPRNAQSFYTEPEAAASLGLSVERFRDLVRTHIAQGEEEQGNLIGATYQSSDLVVLKLLAKMAPNA